jgi:hypothetical protein
MTIKVAPGFHGRSRRNATCEHDLIAVACDDCGRHSDFRHTGSLPLHDVENVIDILRIGHEFVRAQNSATPVLTEKLTGGCWGAKTSRMPAGNKANPSG